MGEAGYPETSPSSLCSGASSEELGQEGTGFQSGPDFRPTSWLGRDVEIADIWEPALRKDAGKMSGCLGKKR